MTFFNCEWGGNISVHFASCAWYLCYGLSVSLWIWFLRSAPQTGCLCFTRTCCPGSTVSQNMSRMKLNWTTPFFWVYRNKYVYLKQTRFKSQIRLLWQYLNHFSLWNFRRNKKEMNEKYLKLERGWDENHQFVSWDPEEKAFRGENFPLSLSRRATCVNTNGQSCLFNFILSFYNNSAKICARSWDEMFIFRG